MTSLTRVGVGATGAALLLNLLGGAVYAQTVVGDQTGTFTNDGTGTADTGTNTGTGNSSDNGATADQTNGGGGDLSVNTAGSGNESGGTASIGSGDAAATGNQATNRLTQEAIPGDGLVIFDQNATLSNTGLGTALTGTNTVTGNESINDATVTQDGGINFANATNSSDGFSSVTTGNACAVGNIADNTVVQTLGIASTTVTSNNLPSDPCRKQAPPVGPEKPPTHNPPPKDVPEALARTGADLTELALAGAGLTVVGGALRRRNRKS
jgi:hypothetical protein